MFFMAELHSHAVRVQECVHGVGHDSTGVESGQHGTERGRADIPCRHLITSPKEFHMHEKIHHVKTNYT